MTLRGLLDTSVFIAMESGRELNQDRIPAEQYVSVITHGELYAGIHTAQSAETRAVRLRTLESLARLVTLEVNTAASAEWGRLRNAVQLANRRVNVNDLWIASIALARSLPVITQDNDFDALADLGGPEVIRV